MSVYSALVFDLDGTLIDSASDIARAMNVGFSLNGWPKLDTTYVEKFIGNGPRRLIIDILDDLGISYDEKAIQRAFDGYLHAYMDDPTRYTQFFPDVREDLHTLYAAGIRLGICTNKNHQLTKKVLEQLGLSSLFDVALGADAVPACKPDPGHLFAVADIMGLQAGTWAYIGDTCIDYQTAKAAGVPFFFVPWGGGDALDIAPEHSLNRLVDLLEHEPARENNHNAESVIARENHE